MVNKPEQASHRDKIQHAQPGSPVLISPITKHHYLILKSSITSATQVIPNPHSSSFHPLGGPIAMPVASRR